MMDATEDQLNYLRRLVRKAEALGETPPVTEDEVEYLDKARASVLITKLRRTVGEVDQ
jgi:hypothetical protein